MTLTDFVTCNKITGQHEGARAMQLETSAKRERVVMGKRITARLLSVFQI